MTWKRSANRSRAFPPVIVYKSESAEASVLRRSSPPREVKTKSVAKARTFWIQTSLVPFSLVPSTKLTVKYHLSAIGTSPSFFLGSAAFALCFNLISSIVGFTFFA